ncbi:hypothetical protein ZWY2020_029200 [Hordeum vulgare]|nr:hypothetical protein ZWY2020_029200 [Hordeum vulgare]
MVASEVLAAGEVKQGYDGGVSHKRGKRWRWGRRPKTAAGGGEGSRCLDGVGGEVRRGEISGRRSRLRASAGAQSWWGGASAVRVLAPASLARAANGGEVEVRL